MAGDGSPMHRTRPSPSASRAWRRTSARPRPRRRARSLCVAPAGSGKTTTLVARVAWLVDGGADPASVCIVAFNKRAAEELTARLDAALAPLGVRAGRRSGCGRSTRSAARSSRDAGVPVEPLVDRDALLRELFPGLDAAGPRPAGPRVLAPEAGPAGRRRTRSPRDPDAGPGRAGLRRLRARRPRRPAASTSTTSSCGRSRCLEADAGACSRAGGRGAPTLLVDEAQDLDRTQLELALLLAAPGEQRLPRRRRRPDDLRLAARRRAAGPRAGGVAARACGGSTSRPTTAARGRSSSAPSGSWSTTGSGSPSGSCAGPAAGGPARPGARRRRRRSSACVRAMRDLAGGRLDARGPRPDEPGAAVGGRRGAWSCGVPFRAPDLALPIEDARLDALLDRRGRRRSPRAPAHRSSPSGGSRRRCATRRPRTARRREPADGPTPADLVTALLGWAAALRRLAALRGGRRRAPARALAELRRDDAALTLATAHGTKGLEWDHVVVLGRTASRARRSVARRGGARAGARGGAAARLRRLDPRPPLADAAVRPARRRRRSCSRRSTPDELGLGHGSAAA